MGKKSGLKSLEWTALGAVFISIFSLSFTILKPGFPSGHDIAAHIVRSKILQEALLSGQFPVRWVEWAWAGASYPLFNFYQAGFYYFAALLNLVIPSHIEAIKIAVLLSWWLGAGFMFLLMRRFGNLPAALAALVFTFTPYIISDVFVRAAYPELAAISFSIGTLWALDRLLRAGKPIFILPFSFCFGAIIIFHLPTLVITAPLILSYAALLVINGETCKKGALLTVLGFCLGLGLTAFYLMPALLELKYVKNELLTSDYYDFRPHFVHLKQLFETKWGYGISLPGANDGMSFQLGIIQWLVIFIALASLFIAKNVRVVFWLLMIVYAAFFMQDISLPFWENWRFISFIQYPWRFLMIVAISCAVLSGLLLSLLKNTAYRAGATISCILLIFIFYRTFLAPAVFVPKSDFDIDAPNWRNSPGIVKNSIVEEGYMPKGVEAVSARDIAGWEITANAKAKAIVEEKTVKDHYFQFTTQSPEPFVLQVNSHYFPGWKAYIDSLETNIDRSSSFYFMAVSVPAGIHNVEIKFTDTPVRSAANRISVISLLVLLLWQFFDIVNTSCKNRPNLTNIGNRANPHE